MSDDFQVGDVVVCVDDKAQGYSGDNVLRGRHYRIASFIKRHGITGCTLEGMNPDPYLGYAIKRFRKLPRADESFTEQMRACRPTRVGEPA